MKNVVKFRSLISVMLAVILCVGILPTFISSADPVDETTVTITQSITFNVVGNKADIVFVIDATGSMGSYIRNVQENLKVFTDILDSGNVDYRIAVITYWDTTVSSDSATTLLTDTEGNYWFTSSDEVADILSTIHVSGGGDGPETPIDGFGMLLDDLTFRDGAFKVAILLTDANYKDNNTHGIVNMIQLINKLIDASVCSSVVSKTYYQDTYSDLYTYTEGMFCDISGDFGEQLASLANHITEHVDEPEEEEHKPLVIFPAPGVAILQVTDAETGNPIAGVKYDLYRVNPYGGKDTKIGTYKTKANGKITVGNTTTDRYYWVASESVEGYTPDTDRHNFSVTGLQFVTTKVALTPAP